MFGAPGGAPKVLLNDGTHRARVGTGTALGAVIGDLIFVTGFNDGRHRAGVYTGSTSNTFISDFHVLSPFPGYDYWKS